MSAIPILPSVILMLNHPGVYICGSENCELATIVIWSVGGRLMGMVPINELAPDRFLDDFVVRSGPHK